MKITAILCTLLSLAVLNCEAVPTAKKSSNKTNNRAQIQRPNNSRAAKVAKGFKRAKAVYFQSNNPSGNAIMAFEINEDGSLDAKKMTSTPTNGNGGVGIDAKKGGPVAIDPLFSQGAITRGDGGNHLFAVNAGTNTLSMFNINPKNPTELTLVGNPVSTLGEFPVSVAYSDGLKIACVLNGGAADGVACYSVDAQKGLQTLDREARKLNIGQSTPPKGPTGTASHIFFNPGASRVFVTIKGDPMSGKEGFLGSFEVDRTTKTVKNDLVRSSPNGTAVLFGSLFVDDSTLVATDASFGAATLQISNDGQAAVKSASRIDGQRATCWVAVSRERKTAFVTDIARNRIVEIDPFSADGAIVQTLDITQGGIGGLIDIAVGGDFLYSFAPNQTSIVVADISGGRGKSVEKQPLALQNDQLKLGMGMAVFV
ncbi:hypothetical protein BKA69DRAFT_1060433 [Paraphysoderma sedebokerense]|nr:hypothetical protein BKA69DRAFT_1060433 [Paraphysoderma sedebokerense]